MPSCDTVLTGLGAVEIVWNSIGWQTWKCTQSRVTRFFNSLRDRGTDPRKPSSSQSADFHHHLFSLRSSSSSLRLRPRLPLTSILPSFLLVIVCRIFLSSLPLCSTSSFFAWSLQMISILLQRHFPKFSRHLWSTFPSVQLSAPWVLYLEKNSAVQICVA